MPDITTIWDVQNNRGDWQLAGGQLSAGDDLVTSVLNLLFTDRQANPDDVLPDGTTDRRGWWADPTLGSRLWLLDRAKQTQDTLNRAQLYITEALQPLIDQGIAARIDVATSWARAEFLQANVTIYRADGTKVALNFPNLWAGIQ